jgi:two-component system response regulator ChvI
MCTDIDNNIDIQSKDRASNIMVVDDDPDILLTIKVGLEEKGFKIDTFSSGESALKAFEYHASNYYDLVLTDIRMPNMNGFALYLYLKEKNPSIKIAFMTAFDIPMDEFRAVVPSVEINDIIKKPFTIGGLATQIKYILNS